MRVKYSAMSLIWTSDDPASEPVEPFRGIYREDDEEDEPEDYRSGEFRDYGIPIND